MSGNIAHYAHALASLHESAKALTHCLGSVRETAERAALERAYMLREAEVTAQLPFWGKSILAGGPKFVGEVPQRIDLPVKSLNEELEHLRQEVFAGMGVTKEVLVPELKDLSGWFDELQHVVSALQPQDDLLTFRKQVEDLLNDDRIRALRVRSAREGNEGPPQADHHR